MSISEGRSKHLLTVIIDTNPSWWGTKNELSLVQSLKVTMSFCNAYLLMKPNNMLSIIAAHSTCSKIVFPRYSQSSDPLTSNHSDGGYEMFTDTSQSIIDDISNLVLNDESHDIYPDSIITGALSTALCYTNRIINEEKEFGRKIQSRILVIQGSPDNPSQYTAFMDCVFAAQKMDIVIDSCLLENESILLQQASDITKGIYIKIRQLAGLLQYLMWVFLPSPGKERDQLNLPPKQCVDYRAACFCHRQMVDIGFICSSCLSVFCAFSPICTTCNSQFGLPKILNEVAKDKNTDIPRS